MNALIFISRLPMPVASYQCNSARTILLKVRELGAQARGRLDIANLVLHSVVEASKNGSLDESQVRL